MRRSLAGLLALWAVAARGEELTPLTKLTAVQQRLVTFVTGAPPTAASATAIPGLVHTELPPTWLVHWQASLAADLARGDARPATHALFRIPLPVVHLGAEAKADQPILAAPLPAKLLVCAKEAPARLRVQVLHSGDEASQTWLGVDIACVAAAGPQLQRLVRLLVEVDPQGRTLRGAGLVWTLPRSLPAEPEPLAVPELPLQPAPLAKRYTWLVPLPVGGWLAQLEALPGALWQAGNALPGLEAPLQPLDAQLGVGEAADPPRYTLLLGDDCLPRAALVHGALDSRGSVAFWHEGAWDAELPPPPGEGAARVLVLQRSARPSRADATHPERIWTDASYAVWQISRDAVVRVALPLPSDAREGVWDCDGDAPLTELTCSFRQLGPHAAEATETLHFRLTTGPTVGFTLQPQR